MPHIKALNPRSNSKRNQLKASFACCSCCPEGFPGCVSIIYKMPCTSGGLSIILDLRKQEKQVTVK